jgi:hypothetical protein
MVKQAKGPAGVSKSMPLVLASCGASSIAVLTAAAERKLYSMTVRLAALALAKNFSQLIILMQSIRKT